MVDQSTISKISQIIAFFFIEKYKATRTTFYNTFWRTLFTKIGPKFQALIILQLFSLKNAMYYIFNWWGSWWKILKWTYSKWIRQKCYKFFIKEKYEKPFYFLTCILPNYLTHEITKEFWKNSHFENMTADFLLRSQNWLP